MRKARRSIATVAAVSIAFLASSAKAAECDTTCEVGCDATCEVACDPSPSLMACDGLRVAGSKSPWHGMYFGVEATFLAPLYDNGPADFLLLDPILLQGGSVGSSFDKANDFVGAPRLTLGVVGDHGFGIQGRYWQMNTAASAIELPLPIVGNQIQALGGSDSFEAYTVDLEVTKDLKYRGWDLFGTFGVRYAEYDQERSNSVIGAVNGDVFSLGSLQGTSFSGTGLTFSLAGLRQIKRHPSLSLFTSARGSTVFGTADTLAVATSSFSGPVGNAGSVNGAIDQNDETLFIAELQAGLQWSRCVSSFNGRMFARAAFEYQFWDAGSGNALAYAESGTFGNSVGAASVQGGRHDFDLVGFSVMTGFAW